LRVCLCVRERARAHVYVTYTHSFSHIRLCMRVSLVDDSRYSKAPPFSVCCVSWQSLEQIGGGLASSAHEWLLQRFAAVTAQRGIADVGPWHLVSLGTLVKRQALSCRPWRGDVHPSLQVRKRPTAIWFVRIYECNCSSTRPHGGAAGPAPARERGTSSGGADVAAGACHCRPARVHAHAQGAAGGSPAGHDMGVFAGQRRRRMQRVEEKGRSL
jgi:hypothetical protein